MWLPIAAGIIGIAVYKKRKEGNPLSYPSWSARVFDEANGVTVVKFSYLKIDDDGEVRCKGKDAFGSYKVRGYIKTDGSVELTQTYYGISRVVQWSGRIVGHNKIAGSWTLGKVVSRFELELDLHQPYLLRRHRNSDTFYDRICLALSPDRQKFRGVGLDQVGYYLVCGRLKDNLRIHGSINYLNKFVIKFDGKRNAVTGEFEGDWTINDGGSGKFNLKRENAHSPANGPVQPPADFFLNAPIPQPFAPQKQLFAPQGQFFAPQAPQQFQFAPQPPIPHQQPAYPVPQQQFPAPGHQVGYAPSPQPAPFMYINLNSQQPQAPQQGHYPLPGPTPFDNN